jgi:hypothetical protein
MSGLTPNYVQENLISVSKWCNRLFNTLIIAINQHGWLSFNSTNKATKRKITLNLLSLHSNNNK